jgi:hypothetical protein
MHRPVLTLGGHLTGHILVMRLGESTSEILRLLWASGPSSYRDVYRWRTKKKIRCLPYPPELYEATSYKSERFQSHTCGTK